VAVLRPELDAQDLTFGTRAMPAASSIVRKKASIDRWEISYLGTWVA